MEPKRLQSYEEKSSPSNKSPIIFRSIAQNPQTVHKRTPIMAGNRRKLPILTFLIFFFFEINAECAIFATKTKTFKYMTTKKKYEKPSTKVYELKQKPQLLQSSVNATMNGVWEEETI